MLNQPDQNNQSSSKCREYFLEGAGIATGGSCMGGGIALECSPQVTEALTTGSVSTSACMAGVFGCLLCSSGIALLGYSTKQLVDSIKDHVLRPRQIARTAVQLNSGSSTLFSALSSIEQEAQPKTGPEETTTMELPSIYPAQPYYVNRFQA